MWLLISRRLSLSGETTKVRSGEAHILAGYLRDALLTVADLMDTALLIEIADSHAHLATRKLLDGFLQCRVFLPDDLIQVRRAKPASCN